MNKDFHDMLCALQSAKADFMVVGAYALGAHGIIRGTLDLDIWVRPSAENAQRVFAALADFGAPLHDVTPADFDHPGVIFQVGVKPNRIDLLTRLSGVSFDQAWENREEGEVFGVKVPVIGRQDMIVNKRASGRVKDLSDADDLEQGRMK